MRSVIALRDQMQPCYYSSDRYVSWSWTNVGGPHTGILKLRPQERGVLLYCSHKQAVATGNKSSVCVACLPVSPATTQAPSRKPLKGDYFSAFPRKSRAELSRRTAATALLGSRSTTFTPSSRTDSALVSSWMSDERAKRSIASY